MGGGGLMVAGFVGLVVKGVFGAFVDHVFVGDVCCGQQTYHVIETCVEALIEGAIAGVDGDGDGWAPSSRRVSVVEGHCGGEIGAGGEGEGVYGMALARAPRENRGNVIDARGAAFTG